MKNEKIIVDYNFTNDFVFKTTIEENPRLAIKLAKMFIKELKDLKEDNEVTFVKKEFKKGVEFKTSIFDINFEVLNDDNITNVNFEMQKNNLPYLNKRTIKYYSDLLTSAFYKSDNYDFRPSYSVWFLDFKVFDTKEFIHRIEMRVDTTNEVWIHNTAIILVEIEKFKNIEYNEDEKRYYELFLTKDINNLRGDDELMNKVADTIEKVNFRSDYRENLRLMDNERRDKNAMMAEAKKEGKAEGKTEVAKKMKIKGLSLEEIVELTGLTKEEIEAL